MNEAGTHLVQAGDDQQLLLLFQRLPHVLGLTLRSNGAAHLIIWCSSASICSA